MQRGETEVVHGVQCGKAENRQDGALHAAAKIPPGLLEQNERSSRSTDKNAALLRVASQDRRHCRAIPSLFCESSPADDRWEHVQISEVPGIRESGVCRELERLIPKDNRDQHPIAFAVAGLLHIQDIEQPFEDEIFGVNAVQGIANFQVNNV